MRVNVEHDFHNVFSVRIHEITLRELILFQSLYVCGRPIDIIQLVEDQPKSEVFFKTFLEFNCNNMAAILAFDNKCMNYLLDKRNEEFFSEEYPVFYKNKV